MPSSAWRIVEWALRIGDESVRARIEDAAARSKTDSWAYTNVIAPCTGALLSDAA
jgi:hypothetical protein